MINNWVIDFENPNYENMIKAGNKKADLQNKINEEGVDRVVYIIGSIPKIKKGCVDNICPKGFGFIFKGVTLYDLGVHYNQVVRSRIPSNKQTADIIFEHMSNYDGYKLTSHLTNKMNIVEYRFKNKTLTPYDMLNSITGKICVTKLWKTNDYWFMIPELRIVQ